MYIESNGELGFPHHRMGPGGEGGWRHHMQSGGPGAEMQVQPQYAQPGMPGAVSDTGAPVPYVMPGAVSNVPGGQVPYVTPGQHRHHHGRRGHHMMRGADGVEIMGFGADAPGGAPVAMPVSQHSDTAMYVAGGVMVLGLAYVLYKVVKS